MNNIRVKNIRSLVDTGTVELSPLTMLLGRNSSGKSTFLRLFPLFKQSWNSKNRGALALYGDFVDFGDFNSLKNSFSKSNSVDLCFDINISPNMRRAYMLENQAVASNFICSCELKIKKMPYEEFLYCSEIKLKIRENLFSMSISDNGNIEYFAVNNSNFADWLQNALAFYDARSMSFPFFKDKENKMPKMRGYPYELNFFIKPAASMLKDVFKSDIENTTFDNDFYFYLLNIIDTLPYASKEVYLKMLAKNSIPKKISQRMIELLNDPEKGDLFHSMILFAMFPSLLENIRMHLFAMSQNIFYSKPLRANAERYYRSQSLAVGDISPDGSNLVSYITNMSYAEKNSFENWTFENFGFRIKIHEIEGHRSIYLNERQSNNEYNVTDMGFGFSQVIPIITQLWDIVTKSSNRSSRCRNFIYAIEQPELHLHPALQAKTLKLFTEIIKTAKSNKIDLKIIMETHSETMINYLGKLICNKFISHNDISILVFDKMSPEAPTTIRSSCYDENGVLENWPFGFFNAE